MERKTRGVRKPESGIRIVYSKGFAIGKRADTIINSANGFLLLGTSGAGRIRQSSPELDYERGKEYARLLNTLPPRIRNDYIRVYAEHGWTPTYAQLSCLRILAKHKHSRFRRGEAVLDRGWSETDRRNIIHAVCMSYKLSITHANRLPATKDTIKRAMTKAFSIAASLGSKSVAVPVCCARKSYGVTPAQSLATIRSVIKSFNGSSIEKVIVCFDNDATKKYLDSLKKGSSGRSSRSSRGRASRERLRKKSAVGRSHPLRAGRGRKVR